MIYGYPLSAYTFANRARRGLSLIETNQRITVKTQNSIIIYKIKKLSLK